MERCCSEEDWEGNARKGRRGECKGMRTERSEMSQIDDLPLNRTLLNTRAQTPTCFHSPMLYAVLWISN